MSNTLFCFLIFSTILCWFMIICSAIVIFVSVIRANKEPITEEIEKGEKNNEKYY